MIKTVLFDLDGTLLPMDQDVFVKTYFGMLAAKLAPKGYDPKKLIGAIWAGTEAMVRNDGGCSNEAAFWQVFCGIFGEEARKDIPLFNEFYAVEFQDAKSACGFTPAAKETVAAIKAMGIGVTLATNPLFPAIATQSRVRWAGMEPEDFLDITTYENSSFCKPNPKYYQQILSKLGLKAEECLMVGNDAAEDTAAMKAGIPVFLITDCLINKDGRDIAAIPSGSFADLLAFIRSHKDD